MTIRQSNAITNTSITTVNVAVAVIHYQDQYLLGFRAVAQHQGNRYEFVGGKIDAHETATQALIREVAEETGIDIKSNTAVKLGRLHHDYGDKQVCLQVYRIEVTAQQYTQYKNLSYGLEGQKLTWVEKAELLAGHYDLPAANKTILAWLQLPMQITVTYPLSHFDNVPYPMEAWEQYHQEHLTAHAWVYIRTKAAGAQSSIKQLLQRRPDIKAIVPSDTDCHDLEPIAISSQVLAAHLTQTQLMQYSGSVAEPMSHSALSTSLPLIVSCHDADSITAANQLAYARLQQQLPPIIGIFLAPVECTQTHPDTPPLGWEAWSELAELADMPVIGLGGLSPMSYKQAVLHGGSAVAGIREFLK
ncbi:NUDIX domain-containing protein [Psychrobacter sp.]|uniref:NUDIX domain-containing protein n=1 Tax=Psychrobacter sp. TaxID=56811 RepID=UPI0035684AD9